MLQLTLIHNVELYGSKKESKKINQGDERLCNVTVFDLGTPEITGGIMTRHRNATPATSFINDEA
jgi:hypothetical protein